MELRVTQGPIPTEHTRPGRIIHLAITATIFVYVLVVELCESQLAPFDGFLPEIGILSALRIGLAVIGLINLAFVFFLLSGASLLSSVRGTFVIAYASLDALAVFGLVLFLIGGQRLDFYGFAAPAFVGQLLLLTQTARWDQWVALEQHDLEITGEEYG
jgi:hypothetical protein